MAQSVKIAIIVGSLRKESINLKLARAVAKLGEAEFESTIAPINDLPLYDQDLEKQFPPAAEKLKTQIEQADAVLIVTPEYNRSMPGSLKNAIDWASRPYGKNAFAKKAVALIGASPGSIGTACAQQSLRPIFGYLDAMLFGQPEVYIQFKEGLIDENGEIANDKTKEFLRDFVQKFTFWVKQHQTAAA